MQESPTDNNANGQAEVSLENILAAIQNQSMQTNASIQQLNMGMERLSEKVDYLHQEQVEMESSHEAIREDMEKLRAGKSLFSDITKEAETNKRKKYPIPIKNENFALNSGEERQMQKIFDQVKSKINRIDTSFDMIEKLMTEIFRTLRMEEVMSGDEGEPITTIQLDEMLGADDDSIQRFSIPGPFSFVPRR